jgi:hypothetical protein
VDDKPTIGTAEFWAIVAREPVSFFVGSAISIWTPSCLPGAAELVDALVDILSSGTPLEPLKPHFRNRQWPRLEAALQELQYCVGDTAIETLDVLRAGRPNAFHRLVAQHLLATGIAYTTNQDELIEAALADLGRVEKRHFIRWTPGMEWPGRALPVLAKLHGTCTSKWSIRTTLQQVHQGLSKDVADELLKDLATHNVCFLGYSGNDIDIRPLLKAARIKHAFWFSRSPGGLPAELRQAGRNVDTVLGDLATFLPGTHLGRSDVWTAPPALAEPVSRMDPFLRACAVSRCVGLSRPDDRDLHLRSIRALRRHAAAHPERWRVWYDAGERRHRGAGGFGGAFSFLQFWTGWRIARRTSPPGAILCLRGMWMSCDLMFLGLFRFTYLPGIWWFEPEVRKLLDALPVDSRGYWEGLVDLLELRGSMRTGRIDTSETLAHKLVDSPESSPHLRGHGLRFLARALALRGRHADVESLLGRALEEFEYGESVVDRRNVHRVGVVCAILRRDLTAGRGHLSAVATLGQADARERARNATLALALRFGARGWWPAAAKLARMI